MLGAVQRQLTEYDYYKGYELGDIYSYELSKYDKVALIMPYSLWIITYL